MKIKLLFGLMLMLGAFTMNAQNFIPAADAVTYLNDTADGLNDGSIDLKDLMSDASNGAQGELTGTGSVFGPAVYGDLFPGIMQLTAKEIMMADDTQVGIETAQAKFTELDDDNRINSVNSVFEYIIDALSN